MDSKQILQEMKKLNFPQGHYIVVGSGPMIVRGIKESNDIDIVVSKSLFEKCEKQGREIIPWTYPDKIGQTYLRRGIVELYLDVNCGDFNPTLEELLARAEKIENISFASLEDICNFKTAYNKPKHLQDIKKIKQYLEVAQRTK